MRHLLFIIVFIAPLWALPAAAEGDLDYEDARQMRESGKILPLDSLLEKVLQAHPGRVLEADLERKRGRLVYELELLDEQGVVWELYLDAVTGEVLQRERDD